jgi:antitoxin component YwqK of YwqJK toxin-antitoxin module
MAKMKTKIQPRLSRIDFFRLHGSDFFNALFRCIDRELGEGAQRANRWASLTLDQQGLHAWGTFWGDVENGGLAQFFYNHTDALVPGLKDVLKASGSRPMAALLEQATALYRRHKKDFAVANPFGSDGLFARMTELKKLDGPVGRQYKLASKRLEKWVRAHIARIAVDENGEPINPKYTGSIVTYYPDGSVFEQANVRSGILSGPYYRYREDHTLEQSGSYGKGGTLVDHGPGGHPTYKKWKEGTRFIEEWYYPSGALQKRYVSNESGGHAVEPIRLWHENGRLAEKLHVKGGNKLGPWLKFFDDGSPRLEAEHAEDEDEGETLIVKNAWDDARRQVVKNGRGTYFDDGIEIKINGRDLIFYSGYQTRSVELRDGIPHGVETFWNDGELSHTSEYVKGELHGFQTFFYDNGRVKSKTRFNHGEEGETEEFPQFDDPRPAVLIEVEANAKRYATWGDPLLDTYPTPLNLDKVQAKLKIPAFLLEIFEQNQGGTPEGDFEDLNDFDDSTSYRVTVNPSGKVEEIEWIAAGHHSVGFVESYQAMIKQLRFEPGTAGGRKVRCRALVIVRHTFVDASSLE